MKVSIRWIRGVVAASVIALGCAAAHAVTYVWTGASSANWSDGANWTNGTAPTSGGTNNVWLMAAGTPPSNQDIPGLYIDTLTFNTNAANYTVGGNPITLKNINGLENSAIFQTNTLNCQVILAANNGWTLPSHTFLFLNAPVGETNGAKSISANGNGNVILSASNTFSGGLHNNQAGVTFYDDFQLGPVPATAVSNFFEGGYGWWAVGNTNIANFRRVTIDPRRGMRTTGNMFSVAPNTKVVYNGAIEGTAFSKDTVGKYVATLGVLVLGGSNSTFTGSITLNGGTTVVNHDNALGVGAAGTFFNIGTGTLDANGHNITTRDVSVGNCLGDDSTGSFKNGDRLHPVVISGNCTNGGSAGGNSYAFGGPGDIVLMGTLTNLNKYGTRKLGSGTLTLKGPVFINAEMSMRGGGLILDYTLQNVSKLSDTNRFYVWHGNVRFVGSDAAGTTEIAGSLDVGTEGAPYGGVAVTLEPGQDQNFTLSCTNLNLRSDNALDLSIVPKGASTASFVVTNADQVVGGGATWNKSTWAKIAGGVITGMGDGEFFSGFAGTTTNSAVNLAAGTTTVTGTTMTCQTLRFRDAGSSTLSISNNARLLMNGLNSSVTAMRPGILVTSNAGPVSIEGPGYIDPGLNQLVFIHQYSAAPLTISTRFGGGGSGNGLVKFGPGEVILANTNNTLPASPCIYGGTLTITNIADGSSNCTIGAGSLIDIGNGTLKYIGSGDSHNRKVRLRGPATVDASGTGTLRFTSATNVMAQAGSIGSDFDLTLAGSGSGIMEGVLDLHFGGMIKTGSGSWTLCGRQYYTGDTTVSNGTLRLSNNCVLARSLSVKAGATLAGSGTIQEDLVMNGTRRVELRGDADYDTLAVGYDATLGGTLQIAEMNGYKMPANLNLSIVTAGGALSGTFSAVTGGAFQITTSPDGRQILLSKQYPGFIFSVR